MNVKNLLNLFLIIIVGVSAYYLNQKFVWFDSLAAALIFGVIIRLVLDFSRFQTEKLKTVSGYLILAGLVLYGVNLEFNKIFQVAPLVWLQLIVSVLFVFWLAFALAKFFKVSEETGILTAVGTAICGASAIVISNAAIKAKNEDVGKALIVVTLWGAVGALLYPFVAEFLRMSESAYALFAATTLSLTGFVKMAALVLGKEVQAAAILIKTVRTALIIPATLSLMYFKKETSDNGIADSGEKKLSRNLIYAAFGIFVLAGLLFSFVPQLTPYVKTLKPYSAFLWTLALGSIGLNVEIRNILRGLSSSLILALLLWLAMLAIFFIGYWLIGY